MTNLNLEDELRKFPMREGGGFYNIQNVKYAANVRIDVSMLVSSVDNPNDLKMLKSLNSLYHYEGGEAEGSLKFTDLKQHLNGYG